MNEVDGKAGTRAPGAEAEAPDVFEYVLRLYVAGQAPASIRAIANIEKICRERLRGKYSLEVIDLYQQPERAQEDQIVAVPTLIKELPEPLRKVIGDLSDTQRVLVGIGVGHR